MIRVYGSFPDAQIQQVKAVIDEMFPLNRSSVVEQGTAFLSEGDLFECSVEKDDLFKRLSLSAEFKGNMSQFTDTISVLTKMLTADGIQYDLEYEIEMNGEFTTYKVS